MYNDHDYGYGFITPTLLIQLFVRVGILFTHGKHSQDCIMSLRGETRIYKTSLFPLLFIEVTCRQPGECAVRYMCVWYRFIFYFYDFQISQYKKHLSFASTWVHFRVFWWGLCYSSFYFSVSCLVFFCFFCLSSSCVLCTKCWKCFISGLSILHCPVAFL